MNSNRVVGLIGEANDSRRLAAQLAGLTFEFLHVAFASLGEALDRSEDSHRISWILVLPLEGFGV
jgi:hypothetical protein